MKCEVAGIEPASCAESTVNCDCGCVKCLPPSAARALHPGGLNCHFLASLDADLQRVIAAWDHLPVAIRKATLALIGSQTTTAFAAVEESPKCPVDGMQMRTLPVVESGDGLTRAGSGRGHFTPSPCASLPFVAARDENAGRIRMISESASAHLRWLNGRSDV
jgi:hypothetical protein